MGREYYSIPEAAALLGLSRIAVFKKVKKGQLAAIRFGRNWAVPAAALPQEVLAGEEASPVTRQAPPPPRPKPAVVPPQPEKEKAELPPPSPDQEMDSMGWD